MPEIRNLGDLLNATLEDFPRDDFDETLQKRDVPLTRTIFGDARAEKSGGFAMIDRLRYRPSTSGRFVVPYEGGGASNQDYLVKVTTEWLTFRDFMLFNELEEAFNSGDAQQIIDLVRPRRSATFEGLYNLMEYGLAREPQNSSDVRNLWGLPYWFRRSITSAGAFTADTTGGFNGQYIKWLDGSTPSATLGTSGPDTSSPKYANLRNWCATYGATFDTTAFKTFRRARRRTMFRTREQLQGTVDRGGRQLCFLPEDQHEQIMDLINSGSTSDKNDMTKFGSYILDGIDLVPTPEFNSLSYGPLYTVKLGYLEGCVLRGRWMNEGQSVKDPDDHFSYSVQVSGTCNLKVRNPRQAGFVMSNA